MGSDRKTRRLAGKQGAKIREKEMGREEREKREGEWS